MVRRRALQVAVAEKVDLVGICIAWRLGGVWIGTVTVSLFISKSPISLHFTFTSRHGGRFSSLDNTEHSPADCHRSLAHVCSS